MSEEVQQQYAAGVEANVDEDVDVLMNNDEEVVSVAKPDESMKKTVGAPTEAPNGFFARRARSMARNPWYHFWTALVVSIVLSVVGFYFGEFSVTVDNAGWQSRGTLISDRESQLTLVRIHQSSLVRGSDEVWDDLVSNTQPGWNTGDDDDARRRLTTTSRSDIVPQPLNLGSSSTSSAREMKRILPIHLDKEMKRRLQVMANTSGGGAEGCDVGWYNRRSMVTAERLWPIWRTSADKSALDEDVIEAICRAEQNTLKVLEEEGHCFGCENGRCLPPFSIVLYARLAVGDLEASMSCSDLAASFASMKDTTTESFKDCVEAIYETGYRLEDSSLPAACPFGFNTVLADVFFTVDGESNIQYTSSVFPTNANSQTVEDMYAIAGSFDNAGGVVSGAYDTQYESFVAFKVDESLTNDMALALGSAAITGIAILVHTRSPWLTMIGLLQIILSFPLAYFVYTFVARLEFFPFLNFIGVFVVFALGADDIFVSVDKWKNARIDDRDGSTEDIAAAALPDAAGAMFLTTITTAIAFFGTAVCPVAPLLCFAVFNGLLIIFDYVMCVVLVFPALCLYDKWLQKQGNCCVSCGTCCRKKADNAETEEVEEGEEKLSLIRRILTFYYNSLHFLRYPLAAVCVGAFAVSAWKASTLTLPATSDVRLLSTSFEYERNYEWRLNLLYESLLSNTGSRGYVMWGLIPGDTGNHNNPNSFTRLLLDETFDASPEAEQAYLVDFCDRFFALDEAGLIDPNYICPMQRFDTWLLKQSNSNDPSEQYINNCARATGVPVAPEQFNACIRGFQTAQGSNDLMFRDEVLTVMLLPFQARVAYDSPYDDLNREWNALEDFLAAERETAPEGVNGMYHSSQHFWWFDTNGQMLQTAYSAAAIALAAAAVVVLFSSRSVTITVFSLFTIGYILAATTAMLVASGWTLGFLESVCFAILIGISCDFVIHFGHAYSHLKGDVSRHDRTKHAIIKMGPSILAASFTTICAAAIMIFTVISFFQRFAMILFYSILNATIGSIIMFNVLTDIVGPSRPTHLVDVATAYLTQRWQKMRGQETPPPKGIGETERADKSDSEDEVVKATSF